MLLILILALPLAGWLLNGLIGGRLTRRAVGLIGAGSVGLAFAAALLAAQQPAVADGWRVVLWDWIAAGSFSVRLGLLLDRLSAVMVLIVTGVGFLIHVYSAGYMREDPGYSRYFAYLNLFIASMLLLVLGDTLLALFVGWELVGLCSYLLIGFWFDRERAASAGRKAFVVNRIGDAAFLLGMILLALEAGTLELAPLARTAATIAPATVTVITLLLFAGATGKSAQLPLYTWLPDAMEGPTPVSALIHAATMVTAGVYMIARLHPLFARAEMTQTVVAVVGATTAFFAATIALVQWDLKRVLAYSTISQLGYMFLAMGLLAMPAGMFHLTTHAFFKALLFLAAGSVMHAMGGVIDLRRLGGLAGPLRWTMWGFLIGALALAGVPPFAGFFSKDLILEQAFERTQGSALLLVWGLGLLTAFVTAVYITRAAIMTFAPPAAHTGHAQRGHPHEAPSLMLWPMGALAVLSAAGGLLGSQVAGRPLLHSLEQFFTLEAHAAVAPATWLVLLTPAVGLLGIAAGYLLYRGRRQVALGWLGTFFERQWYLEPLYDRVIVGGSRWVGRMLADVVELRVIDGAVNGIGAAVGRAGRSVRAVQTGYVRNYAAAILAGTVLLLGYWLLLR
ncbi:MAG TPA: NADH-quinone oxidoreductase subunit L [bacterium]|nr:NADH-quinone oxidoreductase subunit L [bacterium]